MPSQAEIEEYQADVDELSAAAAAEVAALYLVLSGEDASDDEIVDVLPAVIEQYMTTAADLAVDWYRGLARTSPREIETNPAAPPPIVGPTDRISLLDAQDFEPRPAELPPRRQLESTLRWALHEPLERDVVDAAEMEPDDISEGEPREEVRRAPAESEQAAGSAAEPVEQLRARVVEPAEGSPRARVATAGEGSPRASVIPATEEERQARVAARMQAAVQRYVANAARDTVEENAEEEEIRWVRHASANACAFCRMLATRGAVYLSEESAGLVVGRGSGLTPEQRRLLEVQAEMVEARIAAVERQRAGRRVSIGGDVPGSSRALLPGLGNRTPGGIKARGSRKLGEKYHDNCHCLPVPVRAGDAYQPPSYVAMWEQEYIDATNETPRKGKYKAIDLKAVLAHMRQSARARGGNTH